VTRRTEPSELEPKRLLDEHATPDALRDALQALRERAPSPAASARIREQIAKPLPPEPRAPRSLLPIALLALVGVLAWSSWPEHERSRAPQSAALGEAPSIPTPAPLELATPPAPTAPPSVARPLPPAPAAPEPREQPPATAALPAPMPTPQSVRVPKRAHGPLAPKPSSAAPIASVVVKPVPALDAKPERMPPSPKPLSQGEEAERMFADPQDEAGLLYRAKRLSSSDPNAALRLVVLHEASFPDGTFAQERDMLEIQIHERLGHASTAKRLATLFKQRYPESVYRLSP